MPESRPDIRDLALSPQDIRPTGIGLAIAAPGFQTDNVDGVTLIAGRCADCDARVWPPAPICQSCLGARVEPMPLGRLGRLYAFSEIRVPPAGYVAPYTVGYVDMPEGVRIFAHLDGTPDELVIDSEVVLTAASPGSGPPFRFKPVK